MVNENGRLVNYGSDIGSMSPRENGMTARPVIDGYLRLSQ
jgi:hypothetical protein